MIFLDWAQLGIAPEMLGILFAVALVAGWVDSIGGGGGLLSIPALLLAGLTPLETLATNKLQASFGSSTAAYYYTRHGLVDWAQQKWAVILTFGGATAGAMAVQHLNPQLLARLIPWLLMGFAVYFLLSPSIHEPDRPARLSPRLFALTVGFWVGFYDGFFGPGAGMFFTMGYISLAGYGLLKATGNAKLLNFTSNFTALLLFAYSGQIVWLVGFVMALGQILGSQLGCRMAIRRGVRLIRPVLVTVSLLLSLKLLQSLWA